MQLRLLLFCASIFISQILHAQTTIPNSSFENWTPSGKEPPFDWEEPTGWKSSNSMTEWTSRGISKSDDEYEGTYAARVKSVMVNNGWYSILCNGNPRLLFDFMEPDIDIITGGASLSQATPYPAGLSGYYKFKSATAGDSAYAVVIMKRYDSQRNQYDTMGIGVKVLAPTNTYKPFEIPIKHKTGANNPDSFVVAFYSTLPWAPAKPENSMGLGELLVDDIDFVQTLGLKRASRKPEALKVYPNPAQENFILALPEEVSSGQLSITDITGKQVYTSFISLNSGRNLRIDVKHFSPGLYMVKLQNTATMEVYTAKLNVLK